MARASNVTMGILYFIVFVDFFQISFVFPLMPEIVMKVCNTTDGASQIGILGSVAAAAEGFAAPQLGALADRFGRRPIFILAMLGSAVTSALIGESTTFWFLLVARLLQGICGGTAGVAGAYIADVTDESERATYMTYFQAAIFAGLSGGPSVGGWMNKIGGYKMACLGASGICAVNLVLIVFFLPDSRAFRDPAIIAQEEEAARAGAAGDAPAASAPRLPLVAWVICIVMFLTSLPFTAFEVMGVLYLQDEIFQDAGDPLKEATSWFSIMVTGVGVVGLVVNLILYAPIVARTGIKGSIALGGIFSAVSFAMVGVPANKWWFFGFCQGIVFGENMMGTSVQTIITFVVPPSMFGSAIGWMTLFGNVARAVGPYSVTPIYQHVSHTLPWFLAAGVKALAMLICLATPTKPPAVAAAEPSGHPEPEANGPATEFLRQVSDTSLRAATVRQLSRQGSRAFAFPGASAAAEVEQLASRPGGAAGARALARAVTWSPGLLG
ncbi:unnamed protein product [Prorocentrum cordatum]|uniref:Major facilitator superfamily (MFS) profile domain-containing protein n=1 Tax=Prorocentrum cordatum TaxID=2364126 RepID=A0ABN9PKV5_9DINO|nr:unnamed protein product [Polarella glacialis]